jgi:hypothetical protein
LCQLEKRIPYQVTYSTRPRTENKPKEFLAEKNNTDARSMGMNPSAAKPTWGRPIWPGALCLRGHKSETPSRYAGYRAHPEGKRKILAAEDMSREKRNESAGSNTDQDKPQIQNKIEINRVEQHT